MQTNSFSGTILTSSGSRREQTPLVSVVMPVYNGAAHFTDACGTVLRQSMADLELLIVDDGSTDGTRRIADQIAREDPRVRSVLRDENSGLPAVPRNEGIDLARGAFVAFIDHDDIWLSKKLDRQLRVLERRPDLAMVHSYLWGFHGRNPANGLREICPPGEKATSYETLLRGNQVQMSSVLMRTDVLRSLGGFSEDVELRAVEDFELWLRLAAGCRIGYIPEVHGLYRIRPDSISRATAHRDRLAYLDQSRGTHFLHPSGSGMSRAIRRVAVTPAALWAHLGDGGVRYATGLAPRVV